MSGKSKGTGLQLVHRYGCNGQKAGFGEGRHFGFLRETPNGKPQTMAPAWACLFQVVLRRKASPVLFQSGVFWKRDPGEPGPHRFENPGI